MSKTALHQRTTHVLIVTSKTDSHPIPRYVFTFRTIDRLEERGVERVSARDDLQREIEPSLVKTNIEIINVFNSSVGKTSDRQTGTHMGFSWHINTILN